MQEAKAKLCLFFATETKEELVTLLVTVPCCPLNSTPSYPIPHPRRDDETKGRGAIMAEPPKTGKVRLQDYEARP